MFAQLTPQTLFHQLRAQTGAFVVLRKSVGPQLTDGPNHRNFFQQNSTVYALGALVEKALVEQQFPLILAHLF